MLAVSTHHLTIIVLSLFYTIEKFAVKCFCRWHAVMKIKMHKIFLPLNYLNLVIYYYLRLYSYILYYVASGRDINLVLLRLFTYFPSSRVQKKHNYVKQLIQYSLTL